MKNFKKPIDLLFPFRLGTQHFPLKRFFDLVFSILFILIFLPLFIVIPILIKMTSKGSIFYSDERMGRGGKIFQCYKFRSMIPNADKKLKEIIEKNEQLKNEWESNFKLKSDPRVTRFGRFLRKTSIDELPQLINVLLGNMSLVGPRPMVYEEIINHLGRKAYKILSIKPGLTGLWQVYRKNEANYPERIELDEQYVERHSIWLDSKIIALTLHRMISIKSDYSHQ